MHATTQGLTRCRVLGRVGATSPTRSHPKTKGAGRAQRLPALDLDELDLEEGSIIPPPISAKRTTGRKSAAQPAKAPSRTTGAGRAKKPSRSAVARGSEDSVDGWERIRHPAGRLATQAAGDLRPPRRPVRSRGDERDHPPEKSRWPLLARTRMRTRTRTRRKRRSKNIMRTRRGVEDEEEEVHRKSSQSRVIRPKATRSRSAAAAVHTKTPRKRRRPKAWCSSHHVNPSHPLAGVRPHRPDGDGGSRWTSRRR